MMRATYLLGAACFTASVAMATPVVPLSYAVSTDAGTAHIQIVFSRPLDPGVGDEFQIWTTDGDSAYHDVLARMVGTGVEHSNWMEVDIAQARLFSDSAPPVSMVVIRNPGASAGQAQLVSVTPFFPGTQDNGADDYGGWGHVLGYVGYTRIGNEFDVDVPLATLGMGTLFTYFFETFQNGASSTDGTGLVAQWLGLSGVQYAQPLAVPAITPIPEPATGGLLLGGLALLGLQSIVRQPKSALRRARLSAGHSSDAL